MRVSVFGLGYVGCVTAACLARAGHEIVGVDVSQEKVEMINAAASPVVEPGLAELLAEVVGARRLRATEAAQVGEGPDPFEGNVDVVEEDVFALDRRLDPGDQENTPLLGIALQLCVEGDGVVIGDAENLKPGMRRPVDQIPRVVCDEPLPLPSVQMKIGLELHACAPFSPTPPRN